MRLGFAGAAATAIVLGNASSLRIAAGSRAGAAGGLDPVEALALFDIYGNIMGGRIGPDHGCRHVQQQRHLAPRPRAPALV